MNFSNQRFYENKLIAASSVAESLLEIAFNSPVEFIDTAGCGFEEELEPEFKSRYNLGEYNILREHLYLLVEEFAEKELPDIGIISPYREQVVRMKKDVKTDSSLDSCPIAIDTIDAFQGQEREIIYISLVRSNPKGEIGFLKDYRRMNVAMTRAKKKLVVIGDSATIGEDNFYGAFIDYCEKEGEYRSAWEFMK